MGLKSFHFYRSSLKLSKQQFDIWLKYFQHNEGKPFNEDSLQINFYLMFRSSHRFHPQNTTDEEKRESFKKLQLNNFQM